MTQDASDIPLDPTQAPLDTNTDPSQQWTGDNGIQAEDEILQLRSEIGQLREQIARAQADYSNLVRRSREEQSQIGEWSENKTILKFLPILDNLERALEHTPAELRWNPWIEWFTAIVRSMQKVITDMGVTRMDCISQEVNPDLHEVISQVPNADTSIQAEVESGYMRWEKALRHAKVIVGDGNLDNTIIR